jgi:hypothetical protein
MSDRILNLELKETEHRVSTSTSFIVVKRKLSGVQ